MKNILLIIVFLLFCIVGSTQPYNLQIKITNQSKNNIVLGKVRGDRFIFLDSLNSEGFTSDETLTKIFKYKFPENSTIGTYRLILGKTRYAEIMNEPPQQIDFIFNNENINFETDFNDPIEKISIIESEENKAWFAFKNKEKMYRQWLTQLRQTINNSQVNESEIQGKKVEYNMAMMERETFIQQSVKEKPHLFVSKIFKMFHEPLTDAYLNKEEGRIAYVNEYFNNLDFNDEELINTTIYTDKVIHYIQSYGQYGLSREQQENEFIKAVDIVIGHVNKNQVVYEFILDYIVRGFENLNLKKALAHIAEVYGETTCQTDEKTPT